MVTSTKTNLRGIRSASSLRSKARGTMRDGPRGKKVKKEALKVGHQGEERAHDGKGLGVYFFINSSTVHNG